MKSWNSLKLFKAVQPVHEPATLFCTRLSPFEPATKPANRLCPIHPALSTGQTTGCPVMVRLRHSFAETRAHHAFEIQHFLHNINM